MMKTLTTLVLFALVLAFCAFGQAIQPAASAQPAFFVTLGAGFNSYSAPHYAATGSFGAKIGDGLYSITSLDNGTTYDATTKTRQLVSTLRTGVMKVITSSGPVTIAALGDAGIQAGSGTAAVGSFSAGGVLSYTFKKQPNAFAFGSVRIVKAAQSDPAVTGTQVQPAFTFGVGWRFH